MDKNYRNDHLVPIDTRKIIEMIELQRLQTNTLHDIISLIADWQHDWAAREKKPIVPLTILPKK